jgi:prepilin-type N-terminal cleavage/methylation domain-containing protein
VSANPYESPETPSEPVKVPGRRGFRLVELLVVVAVIGLLIACLLPAVRTSGTASRRISCSNNLKQIALGLQDYHDTYGCFPPAYTVDTAGKPLHSWRTLILPFVEQKTLYERIDLSKPWDDPANQFAFDTTIRSYQCASVQLPKSHTNYLAVVGPGAIFEGPESRKLSDVTDGPGATLMVIEVPAERAVHWMSPHDASEAAILEAMKAKNPPHPSGAQAARVDSSVTFLRGDLPPETLRALISIAGDDGEAAQAAD